jgi:membrane-bound lytic murein transglycosylase B
MTRPRRWVRRAALSVLAGSGLTAASLGGAAGALGAEATTATTPPTETTPPPVTETTPQASAPETSAEGQQSSGQTTSTTTATTPASTPSGTVPSSTAATPPAPASTPAPPAPSGESATAAPTVVVQHKQRVTRGAPKNAGNGSSTAGGAGAQGEEAAGTEQNAAATAPAGTPNGVAPAPQAVGGEAGGLAFAGSAVSAQALDFYRVPLFLLPVYQAAAIQYDVPWQILAAINEVETDYGTDLSVSTAGAVGWMQFMPATWLQYGVDATDAGYADPYNPVDAIFAAARYLHAAGASRNLHRAILAYNHSQAYVESVLLRARLIASYPSSVIGTLTGLVDGRLPTAGAHTAPGAVYLPETVAGGEPAASDTAGATPGSTSGSATAGAVPASPLAAGATALRDSTSAAAHVAVDGDRARGARHDSAVPGSTPAPPPQVAAARAETAANAPAKASQLMELLGKPGAPVVAVQGGRVVHLGDSHALGRYLVLRDVYGDIFTYAGLGSVAPRYRRPVAPSDLAQHTPGSAAAGGGESASDPAPTQAATAGHQTPLTLQVKAHSARADAAAAALPAEPEGETAPAGMGKVRLYAHPANPLARAAKIRAANASTAGSGRWLPLRSGVLVSQGTVLGHLYGDPGADAGKLRFAVRPAGDSGTINPSSLLVNWKQLGAALHPRGSKGSIELLGATADDVFAMSKSELQSSVLADPGIQLDACGRKDIAAGAVDRRVLGVLEFLSRSGLQPTVAALRCARSRDTAGGRVFEDFDGAAVEITAVNGISIAGHQGPGTITDTTIRALLTLGGQFAPHRIVSLMQYPKAPSTLARAGDWDRIRIGFGGRRGSASAARVGTGQTLSSSLAASGGLSKTQWQQLISRIAALPQPTVSVKPSSAAIHDPQAAPTNRGLGAR